MNDPTPDPGIARQMLASDRFSQMQYAPNRQAIFLYSGMSFLLASLCLFAAAALMLYKLLEYGGVHAILDRAGSPADLNFLVVFFLPLITPSLLVTLSAIICIMTGIRLLRAAGITTKEVLPQRDYSILAAAIQSGDDKAITEYIRLSSLTGVMGTFTQIGLTGLPLATIFLTIVLSILGLFVQQFFDLAQLTLGAFIGSYVQKQRSEIKE